MSRLRNSLWWVLAVALVVRAGALWIGQTDLRDDPDAYARLAENWSSTGVLGFDAPDGTVQPTAFRPPLYPWLLSWLAPMWLDAPRRESFDSSLTVASTDVSSNPTALQPSKPTLPIGFVAALHLLLGLASVGLTWSIARDLRIAWPAVAAILVACDPILVRASQLVMTETLAAFLALVAWKFWLVVYPPGPNESSRELTRMHCPADAQSPSHGAWALRSLPQWCALFGLGIVFGLSVLARPTAAPWTALCLLGMFFFSGRCWKQRINDSLIVGLLVVACLSPWVLRNLSVFSKPIWATTHGGYTLLLANNPLIYQHFTKHGPSRNWEAEPFHARWSLRLDPGQTLTPSDEDFWLSPWVASGQSPATLNELADDRIAYEAARATIARQPLMFGLSGLYRVGWLWAAWPNTGPRIASLAIGLWYTSLFAAAFLGIRRMIRRYGLRVWAEVWWLPLMLVVSLTIIHSVYWSNMRMRAPASAVLAVAAAAAVFRKDASDRPLHTTHKLCFRSFSGVLPTN